MDKVKNSCVSLITQDPALFEFTQRYGFYGFLIYNKTEPEHIWLNPQILRHLEYYNKTNFSSNRKLSDFFDIDGWKKLLQNLSNTLYEGFLKIKDRHENYLTFSYKATASTHGSKTVVIALDKLNKQPEKLLNQLPGLSNGNFNSMQRRSELKRLFIQQAPTAIAMFDTEVKYIAASEKWLKDYGIEGEEITGRSHYEIFPEISADWKIIHQECLNGKVHRKDEDCFERADGSIQWITWEVKPWYTPENDIGGIIMHTADITRLKQSEIEIYRKQELMEKILESINVGIVSCDAHGNLTLFNQASKDWHGLPATQIPKEELSSYYGLYNMEGTKMLEEHEIPLIKTLQQGAINEEEIRIKQRNGKEIIVSANGHQLFDKNGNLDGAVVAMHNITHRLEAERKLQISEQTFRGNFEYAAIGMAIIDTNGRWLKVNKSLCKIVGYSAKELQELTFQDITHPDDLNLDLSQLSDLVAGKIDYYHMNKRYFHKNGNIVFIKLAVSLVKDENSQPLHFVSQIIDVTKEKKASKNLQIALGQLKGIFEASSLVSIIATDKHGMITSFNRGAENLLGYSKEEMLNSRNIKFIHSEDELLEFNSESESSETSSSEFLEAIAENTQFEDSEWKYVQKNGNILPVQLAVTPIRENGRNKGYLCMATNITKLKNIERELSSVMMVTREQNARLKNFAHIVSHNLRSHSSNLGMLLDLYRTDFPEMADNVIINLLVKASGNLSETIQHLNEVTLINTTVSQNLKAIDLNTSLDKILDSISAIVKREKVKINNHLQEDAVVKGIPAYVDSILLNFITNAVKYKSPERPAEVNISSTIAGKYLKIIIEDNGLGIDLKKHGSKLFGMYKTFHNHEDSRGIGLFITKNQIEALGGKVEVTSKLNVGTKFIISLKIYEES